MPRVLGQAGDSSRFQRWETHIGAFVALADPSSELEGSSRSAVEAPLAGLDAGVKDIIDVSGHPTCNGSKTCADAMPVAEDSEVVATLRDAGARIIGKTTTTEFAFTDPTDCRNPHDLSRSPGGSSSGSGAAVAAGLVDFALGTQTAGSLCRPAAYCGVVGYKPSFGLWPTVGVTPLAPSFDTVGVIASSVEVAIKVFKVLTPEPNQATSQTRLDLTYDTALFDGEIRPTPEAAQALRETTKLLEQICVKSPDTGPLPDIAGIVPDHRIVMNHEAFQAHGHLLSEPGATLLQPKFHAGLKVGEQVTAATARDAMERLALAKQDFWASRSNTDVILTLPVPEGAPLIGETTGFQDWLTPWTVFGGPLVCIPWGLDALGRPRSVMLASCPGTDAMLLDVAHSLEAMAPARPEPILPDG